MTSAFVPIITITLGLGSEHQTVQMSFPKESEAECMTDAERFEVSLLFDTMEAFKKFGDRLQPVLQELGMDPGTPDIMNVHHIIRRAV